MALLESTLYQIDGSDIELVLSVSDDIDAGLILVLLDAAGVILELFRTHCGRAEEGMEVKERTRIRRGMAWVIGILSMVVPVPGI